MRSNKPLDVLKAKCPEFYDWLKEISRYSKVEDFILPDYKNGVRVSLYTKDNIYSIVVRLPKNDDGYLGCMVSTRKPRAGEDWNRGRDLPDGKYCYETWQKIKDDIVAYELVKVVKKQKEIAEKN